MNKMKSLPNIAIALVFLTVSAYVIFSCDACDINIGINESSLVVNVDNGDDTVDVEDTDDRDDSDEGNDISDPDAAWINVQPTTNIIFGQVPSEFCNADYRIIIYVRNTLTDPWNVQPEFANPYLSLDLGTIPTIDENNPTQIPICEWRQTTRDWIEGVAILTTKDYTPAGIMSELLPCSPVLPEFEADVLAAQCFTADILTPTPTP